MTNVAAAGLVILLALSAPPAGLPEAPQPKSYEAALADLRNPSTRARIGALRALADEGRVEAVAPMATLLLDGSDDVQEEAIDAILRLYLVDADLRARPWGPLAEGGRPRGLAEAAYEAGPLAVIPAPVPGDVLTNLSTLVRQDDRARTRLQAAYGLGVLGAPAMGVIEEDVRRQVEADLVYSLQHPNAGTRQVAARVAGRVFESRPGVPVSVAVGDGLIAAMNDSDGLVRDWAMDSLGRMKYERAVQALTDHASYYGRAEEGVAALHALARIGHPASAAVFRALLSNAFLPFRVISIEGLGRLGECALESIDESVATANDASVALAGEFARYLCGPGDLGRIAERLDHRSTAVQARVYLEEIGMRNPASLTPLLKWEDPDVRILAVRVIGASGDVRQEQALQPLLQDPEDRVVEEATEAIRRLRAYGGTAPVSR